MKKRYKCICEVCGRKVFRERMFKNRCCSKRCWDLRNSPEFTEKPCEMCGKTMHIKDTDRLYDFRLRRTCSSRCKFALWRKTYRDNGHDGRYDSESITVEEIEAAKKEIREQNIRAMRIVYHTSRIKEPIERTVRMAQ